MITTKRNHNIDSIKEIDENEYRYIAASGDWEYPTFSRNDVAHYNDWD